ncbi:MAG: TonB-dependent receptor family protein, partial [Wenzhouxiangella sp.]
MNTLLRPIFFLACCTPALLIVGANAAAADSPAQLEPMTIVGTPEQAQLATGGATVVTERDLDRFEYTDIQRILRQVPGVSLQLEDGYGLRPNISIRGTASDRSSRITMLEDGVLIAPAPYAAPAAYYFPTAARLQGVEVLKGPAAILEGPYTTGGAVNFLSTRIPEGRRGQAQVEAGSHGHLRGHAWYGNSNDRYGFVVEGHEWRADGFQDIDRSSRDAGLNKSDYMVRLRTDLGAGGDHRLELKLRQAEETSNQTYFGLTDADFRADRNRRYGLSELDQINTDHEQVMLSYRGRFGDNISVRASAYNNDFSRDWFKTEAIDLDGSDNAQNFSGTSWFNVIQAVNRGQNIGNFTPGELQAILDGTADTAIGAIQIRNNARDYYARGVQGEVTIDFLTGAAAHELRVGLRVHEDQEDRLQRNSTYSQINGSLVLADRGLLGNAGNRIEDAEAIALWVYDSITIGRLTLSPGVRYESIDLKRTRYEDRVGRTDDPSSRDPSNLRDVRNNDLDVWIPGIGVRYALTRSINLIGGVSRGFSAPSSDPNADPERSTNYETGLRFNNGRTFFEAMGFWNDYSNLVGACTTSSGANCQIGDLFSGDAARVRGLELAFRHDLSSSPHFGLPLSVAYTWSDGEFRSNLADSNFFGDAERGDPIPYLPEHEIYVSLGFEVSRWAVNASVSYVDSS